MGHIWGPKPHVSLSTLVGLLSALAMDIWVCECRLLRPNFAVVAALGHAGNTVSPWGKERSPSEMVIPVADDRRAIALGFCISSSALGRVEHSQTPQPGVAGRSRNLSRNTTTHTAHPCQEWLGASGAHTQPNTPAKSGGAQPKPEPKHTHPHRAPVPGLAGCKPLTQTAQQPIQEGQGAAETRAQTPTPRTPARSGWVQVEHAHSPKPQPGVAGRSRNPSSNTHIHTAHPCQEWLGASGARRQPDNPARCGGAQPKPEPKHTHPHRAPVPGVAGCKRSTHAAQHPSQEWRGAAKTRAQTHTPTPRTRARIGWVQAEHAHSPTPQPGVVGRSQNPEPKHTHPHRAPVPGVARCTRSTHTAEHPSQEWRGAVEIGAQTQTPTPRTHARSGWVQAERSGTHTQPNIPARSGGAQPKPEPEHTHPHPAPVPGVAGCKRSTHTAQHPSQEWRGAAETRAQTHTPTPRTRARSGWVQAKHAQNPTPQPGMTKRS